jgi:beta-lactamase regulating signal transducer with metallopeptidase domain
LLLLLARLVMARVGDPARRQRLGEIGLLSALLVGALALGPAWLPITLPAWVAQDASPTVEAPSPSRAEGPAVEKEATPQAHLGAEVLAEAGGRNEEAPAAVTPAPAPQGETTPSTSVEATWSLRVENALVTVYAVLAGLFLVRWLFAHVALAWLLRGSRPAPAAVAGMLEEIAPEKRVRLLVSPRVRVPFSFGLFRPTMVLPVCLAEAPPRVLRWVLAHERAHLERRDGWVGLLLALGQAAFFYVPWYWWLRKQVRLCQEYVADAAAVAAGGRAEDYAEFLLSWASSPAAPVGTSGVFGSSSDLYRRITMLLQPHPPEGNRRRWPIVAGTGFLALAVILAGLRLNVGAAAPVPKPEASSSDKKPAPADGKKEEAKKDKEKRKLAVPVLPDIDKLLERLPPGTDEAQIKALRRRLELMRKQIERQTDSFQKQIERQTEQMARQMEQQAEAMRKQFDRQRIRRLPLFARPGIGLREGRMGVLVKVPESTLANQLDLPKGQGLVLEDVGANSAAAKAGLKPHDILLELNGKPVPNNPEDFIKQLGEIKPDTPVKVVVLRKGKKETIKGLSLPEAKQPVRPVKRPGLFPEIPVPPR